MPLLLLVLTMFAASRIEAAVTITTASGGTNVSADSAQNGVAPAYTTLGNIVITEGATGDISTGTSRTLILTAPSGWQFNPGVGSASSAKVSGSGGNEISAPTISVTSTTITLTFDVTGTGQINSLTISGIQVRSTEGGNLPASGTILRTSGNPGNATINGITNDSTAFGSLSQAVGALRLYTILPPQTYTDAGTVAGSGISGTPDNQAAGVAFDITTLIAADREYNIATTYSGTKTISYSGPGGSPTYTTSVVFTNGQSSNALTTTLPRIETTTITTTDGAVPGVASSNLTVTVGPFAKLQLLVPGETAAPGTASGKTGTPSAQTDGLAFTATVNAVDANWNLVNTVSDTVAITSSDGAATLPADAALVSGTKNFSVTFGTSGAQTLTATNLTDGTKTSDTSPSIIVQKRPTTTALSSSANPSCAGDSVTFTAIVTVNAPLTGTPTGTVDFKDGGTVLDTVAVNSSGQVAFSTSSLTGGAHSMTAVYSGDDIFSTSISLVLTQTISTPPAVTLNPTNRTVCAGSSASFSTAASGIPSPAIQWQASGDGGSTFTNVTSATNATLTFTAALADSGKIYHAVFSNACGTATSGAALLTVNALPVCGITGANRVCANSTGNNYSGPDGLTGYRWAISGSGTLASDTNAQIVSVTAGASPTFTLTLTVTNASGCISTCNLVVTNLARPTATVSGGGTICSGNNINIQAALTGSGPWTVAWSDGVTQSNIAASPATRSVSPAATTIYTVTSVTDTNCSNTGTSGATVTVNTAPQVTLDPTNIVACASSAVTFAATASGTPTPAVQWQVSTNGGLSFSNLTGQTSSSYTFTPVLADNGKQYRARFTNTCGAVFSAAAALTVNPRPTAAVSGGATLCLGQSADVQADFTGTGPWTVVWSDGATIEGIQTSPLIRTVTPSATTTYTVTSVSDFNCTNSGTGSATIAVNTPPSLTVSPTNRIVCAGSVVSFSATVSGNPTPTVRWECSGDGGTTFTNVPNATNATLAFTAALSDDGKQYRVGFSNVCGTADSSAATLAVNAVPACAITGADRACTNTTGNVYLAADGLTGYRWTISGSGTIVGATNTSSVSVTAGGSSTFTLTLTLTNASGCTSTCTKTVTNIAKPTATVSGSGMICPGGTNVIQAALTGFGPWTVAWSDGVTQTNVAASPAARNLSPSSTTTYTVSSVTDTYCANTGTGSATVTVNVMPSLTLNPTNRSVCAGSSVSFIATANGSPAPTVQWQASGDGGETFTNISGATSTTLTFTTAQADHGKLYHAVFSNVCGTATTANATLIVNALPACAIGGGNRVCTNTTGNIFLAPDGLTGYRWTISGSGTIVGATTNPSVSVTAGSSITSTFTLTLTLTNASGCTSTCTKTVTNSPKPAAVVSGNSTVCQGSSANIQAALTGNGPWTVAWSDGVIQPNVAASPATRSVSPPATTTYTVTNVADSSCSAAGTGGATVTVNTAPQVTLDPSSAIVCVSNPVMFTATASGTPTPAVQWQVSTNGGLSFSNITGATSTTYTFTVTNANNGNQYRARFTNVCATVFSSSATLTVNPRPTATVSGSTAICHGESADLQADLTGTGPWTVVWSDGVTILGIQLSPLIRTVTPTVTTTYTVTALTDANACTNVGTGSAVITVATAGAVTADPTNRIVCEGSSVSFTAAHSGSPPPPVQWQVSEDGGFSFTDIPGATNATYTFTPALADNGTKYRAVFSHVCGTAVTASATLTVNAVTACAITGADRACTNTTGNVFLAPDGVPGYRWTISGSGTIVGTNNTASVNVTAGASGTFTLTLTLTNASGCTSTCTKTVTNSPKPGAVVSGNSTICPGNSANIQAALTGNGPWTLAWSDGVTQPNVAASPATRSVSPSATTVYTVTNVADSSCSVAGTGSATVTVNRAPQVTLDPSNAVVFASNSVTFTATASGTPTPAAQWQVSTNGGLSFSNLTGATTTTYTFIAALSDNGKQYRARFTNTCGPAFSSAATLTVLGKTLVLLNPAVLTNGAFRFEIWGPTNVATVIQRSSNLATWLPVATNVYPNTPGLFTDPSPLGPYRFYRALQP